MLGLGKATFINQEGSERPVPILGRLLESIEAFLQMPENLLRLVGSILEKPDLSPSQVPLLNYEK